MRLAALAVLSLYPAAALANPVTAGASLGVLHDKVDQDGEGNQTYGLWGRVNLGKRVAGQLELMRIETDDGYSTPTAVRAATALFVVDLVEKGRLVPVLMAGFGLDRATSDGYDTVDGHHFEGGLGLEYRSTEGLTFGIDVRFGGRSVDNQQQDFAEPVVLDGPTDTGLCGPEAGCTTNHLAPYDALRDGEYRALRLTLGIRF